MSIKMESNQRTPSVIARLMGLDELSPRQPVQKKQRVLSENYLRRVASIRVKEQRHSIRLGVEEKKEFKDAVEVLENLKRERDYNLSDEKGKVNLSSSELKMAFMGQKFVEENCGSVDMLLRTSKEGHDTLGVVDLKVKQSGEDFQVPGSLITEHLHDLQGIHHHSQTGHIKILSSSYASDSGKTDIGKKSWQGFDQGSTEMLHKLETGLLIDSQKDIGLGNIQKLLRSRMGSDNGMRLSQTKIVVLKPSLGCSSYGDSHSVSKKNKEFLRPEKADIYVNEKEKKNVAKVVEPARLIARRLEEGKDKLSTKALSSESRDIDTTANESELVSMFSSISSYRKNQYWPSFYHSDRSYMARQAKKEILERWKTTEKFQEVEVAGSCKTLGEMLSIPDHGSRPKSLDFRLGSQIRFHSNCFRRPLESAKWLRHGSRMQAHNQNDSSKFRNSRSSCTKSGNSYSLKDDRLLLSDLKRKLEEKDPCEKTSLVNFSSCSDICPDSDHRCTIQENNAIQEELKFKLEEKDFCEQNCVVPESSRFGCPSDSIFSEMVIDAETATVARSSEHHKDQDLKPTDCTLLVEEDDYCSQTPENSTQQDMLFGITQEDSFSSVCSCTDFESLVNLEAAYQPSPNSVLEPPFDKEISSSPECFQGVKDNLHGLHLELELLKSESLEAYSEGAGMVVSSDDESNEGSVSIFGENEELMRTFSIKESRDFSYLVDVFTEAGFHGRHSDLDCQKWYSSECPISSAVFEMLEKKYGEQMSWKRSERRLLFDRINSELREIVQTRIGMHWTKPVSRRLCFSKSLEAVEEELWKALTRQQKQVNKDSSVKVLWQDDRWLELEDDIEVVVTEIENSLIDQLATEVVSMDSF